MNHVETIRKKVARSLAYKESMKSICHHCTKINDDCFHAAKFCGTDNKIGKSYVRTCNEFEDKNKEEKK